MANIIKNKDREYYLDWIRVCVVLILIPFHTAVSFSHIGHAYVYTEEAINSLLYNFISDFFNLWFMRMLFFVSGIAVFMGLNKRTMKEFIIDKFKRLIVPVIFVVLTIGPLSGYILAIQHYNFTGSFISFYPQFYIHLTQYLFWGHMWYCVYLFAFSMIALPLFFYLKKNKQIVDKINSFLAKKSNIFLPMLIIVIFEMIFRPFYPGLQSLIGDWANFTVHLSFFIFGYIMGQSKKLFTLISKKMISSLIIALFSTSLYIYIKRFSGLQVESYRVDLVLSMFWGIAAYSWVLFFIAFFKRYINKSNRLLSYLSKTSFSLYVFHYFIISILNYFLLQTNLNHYLVWGITSLSTYVIFLICYEFLSNGIKILKNLYVIRYISRVKNNF